jgi:Uma2 family endonuclease
MHVRGDPVSEQSTLLTADEYFRVAPPDWKRCELIDGALVVSPNPTIRHITLVKRLLRIFFAAEDRGLLDVYPEPNVVLAEHQVPQPDLAIVLPSSRERVKEKAIVGPPDLAIEVLSPSTRRYDLGPKKRAYARAGVLRYWVVDPADDQVLIYRIPEPRLGYGRPRILRPPARLVDEDLGVEVDLTALFAR